LRLAGSLPRTRTRAEGSLTSTTGGGTSRLPERQLSGSTRTLTKRLLRPVRVLSLLPWTLSEWALSGDLTLSELARKSPATLSAAAVKHAFSQSLLHSGWKILKPLSIKPPSSKTFASCKRALSAHFLQRSSTLPTV
jgi:hypothetical protein